MKISVQSGGVEDLVGVEKGYEMIRKAGFTAIDWNALDHALTPTQIRGFQHAGNIYERPIEEVYAYFADEVAEIRKNGLTITQGHAPFPAYVPGHPETLDYMIEIYKKVILLCDHYGCKNLVIHGISLAHSDKENTPETIHQMNMKLYTSLIPTLQKCNVVVCLENLFTWDSCACNGVCSDPEEAVSYIDKLNELAGKEVFGFCLDTGHAALLGRDFRQIVPVLGKRIKCLHIHDNDGRIDRHLAPMTGKINWRYFCDSLRSVGYDGDLNFETFQQTIKGFEFGEEMLMAWLQLIFAIGKRFRDAIQK